jgi:hypothetical protein
MKASKASEVAKADIHPVDSLICACGFSCESEKYYDSVYRQFRKDKGDDSRGRKGWNQECRARNQTMN